MKRGFTLLEIVLVVGITAILVGIVLFSFNDYRRREVRKASVLEVVSILREARAKTLVAEGDSVYGVHFDQDQAVLFVGAVYDASSTNNQIFELPLSLGLATTSLGATEVVFSRLSGLADAVGAISVYELTDPAASTTITVSGAGIISSP